jgi:hypothetical protein
MMVSFGWLREFERSFPAIGQSVGAAELPDWAKITAPKSVAPSTATIPASNRVG